MESLFGRSAVLVLLAVAAAGVTRAGETGLDEVVVTARFKSESLQTAPIAITR